MTKRRSTLSRAFGAVLREARLSASLSQETVAAESGIHRTYLSMLERGLKSPTLDVVARLADAVGLTAHKLVEAAEKQQRR